ncbi:hypothetical protein H0H93_008067 [Arthromyces matolae]|nr:hypothetical protein H0H93_008067 [Arthromyces matolae]
MWHVYYAWDEALEHLYQHICRLKADIMRSSNLYLLEELHVIHVRHLQYTPLLEDLRKTITFLINTPNPALDALPESEKVSNRELLAKECNTLIYKVSRLETSLKILDEDVKNTSNLALSSVNIHDSRRSIAISDASMKDNGGSCQSNKLALKYPNVFSVGVFGMNVNNLVPGTNGTMENMADGRRPSKSSSPRESQSRTAVGLAYRFCDAQATLSKAVYDVLTTFEMIELLIMGAYRAYSYYIFGKTNKYCRG